jgi:hypothetical protein
MAFVAILVTFSLISNWDNHRSSSCGCDLESNLEFRDMISTHLNATKLLEERYADSRILTTDSQNLELKRPWAGYVTKELKSTSIREAKQNERFDVFYYSPQSSDANAINTVLAKYRLSLIAKFEKNGKSAAIYELSEKE